MLRLVDRVFGEGSLHHDDAAIAVVGYELDVYRDWIVRGADLEPGAWVIEGHLMADAGTLASLAGRATPFSLHLDDGRHLALFILDPHGRLVNVEGTTLSAPEGESA